MLFVLLLLLFFFLRWTTDTVSILIFVHTANGLELYASTVCYVRSHIPYAIYNKPMRIYRQTDTRPHASLYFVFICTYIYRFYLLYSAGWLSYVWQTCIKAYRELYTHVCMDGLAATDRRPRCCRCSLCCTLLLLLLLLSLPLLGQTNCRTSVVRNILTNRLDGLWESCLILCFVFIIYIFC